MRGFIYLFASMFVIIATLQWLQFEYPDVESSTTHVEGK